MNTNIAISNSKYVQFFLIKLMKMMDTMAKCFSEIKLENTEFIKFCS
jgi:hypothetical protein